MSLGVEIFILLTFYSFLWAFFFYYLLNIKIHTAFKLLIIAPILLFMYYLDPTMIFAMLPALFIIYKVKLKTHIAVVLINLALICYIYYPKTMNLYKFQKMCENKEYYVEIVNSDYSIDEIKNREYRILNTEKSDLCDKDVQYCPKITTVVHDGNVFLKNTDRLIAKTYKVFRPYSRLEIVASSFSRELHGEYCGYNDISEILIKNSKRVSDE